MTGLPAVEEYVKEEAHWDECFMCHGEGGWDVATNKRWRRVDKGGPLAAPSVEGGAIHIWDVQTEDSLGGVVGGSWRGRCYHSRGKQPRADLIADGPICAECAKRMDT